MLRDIRSSSINFMAGGGFTSTVREAKCYKEVDGRKRMKICVILSGRFSVAVIISPQTLTTSAFFTWFG